MPCLYRTIFTRITISGSRHVHGLVGHRDEEFGTVPVHSEPENGSGPVGQFDANAADLERVYFFSFRFYSATCRFPDRPEDDPRPASRRLLMDMIGRESSGTVVTGGIAGASATNWRVYRWTFVVMTTVRSVADACSRAGASAARVLPVPQAPSKRTSSPRASRKCGPSSRAGSRTIGIPGNTGVLRLRFGHVLGFVVTG